jgi:hypothetical protein
VRRPPYGSTLEPSVVGHEPTPSYDFTPDARTLAPAALLAGPLPAAVSGSGAWALRRPVAQMRYAPRYTALGVSALDHQLARFRRGDTLVVVGAYAAPAVDSTADSTAMTRLTAALVVDDTAGRPAAVRRRDDAPRTGALVAALPAATALPWLASLELLDTAATGTAPTARQRPAERRWHPPGGPQRGRAARVRVPLATLPADAAVSDLLLVRPGDFGPAPSLAAVADSAAGAPVIRAGDPFGLYWELYGTAPAQRTVSITATRVGTSAWDRLGALVGRAIVTQPVSLRYLDPVAPTAPPGRYVALRWPVVPPGTYRLAVSVAAGTPADPRPGATPDATPDTTPDTTGARQPAAAPAGAPAAATLVVRVVR